MRSGRQSAWWVALGALVASGCVELESYVGDGTPEGGTPREAGGQHDGAADLPGKTDGEQRVDGRPPPPEQGPPAKDIGPEPDTVPCVCTPGTQAACGPCNKGLQTCNASCRGYGTCVVPSGVCNPGDDTACGNCNKGTRKCNGSCSWGSCSGGGSCVKGDTKNCPNNCGQRTCDGSCNWGNCSKAGQLVSPGPACWSSNHCGPGNGRCVSCYQRCNNDGSLRNDDWCGACSSCSPVNPNC